MSLLGEWLIDEPETLKVVTWNVLADSCCDKTPYGFPNVDDAALDRTKRSRLQMQEMLNWDADVIALQEVDEAARFADCLRNVGYSVEYRRRDNSKLGLLMAFKTSRVTVQDIAFKTFECCGSNMYCRAVITATGITEDVAPIVVVTTHLKAKSDGEPDRINQVAELLRDQSEGEVDIFLGDFNDVCGSAALNQFNGSYTNASSIDANNTIDAGEYSTFKVRSVDGVDVVAKCKEDHIYFSSRMQRCAALIHPGSEALENPGLPSLKYPSDHLSVGCQFNLKCE